MPYEESERFSLWSYGTAHGPITAQDLTGVWSNHGAALGPCDLCRESAKLLTQSIFVTLGTLVGADFVGFVGLRGRSWGSFHVTLDFSHVADVEGHGRHNHREKMTIIYCI